ncbi:hypothetical protein J7E93_06615 [Streptomyces sp. ISL-36]|uniref:hypothetical protein n=1 Tax=Streptomyces sp. ISL-36 TaxID=2819182 RepID=UPI001BE97683|nr:hypothetical protein [Streptomyces sp. ISL-36]MBT2439798.1 hypothetical protein [Streptomyces sp. ISL-36]
MGHRTVWEIDVPIEHRQDKTRKGVHVFTGLAENSSDAIASALRACEIAQLHAMSGQPIPAGTSRVDWSARGLRPDWELCWDRAEKKQIVL